MRSIRPRSSGRLRLLALVIAFSLVGSTGAAISLAAADGMVMTGRVTAPDGASGIAGATVSFVSWTTGDVVDSATRTTDEDGSYSTVLPADEWGYELHAEPPADNPGFYGPVVDYGPDYDGFQVTEAGISDWVTRLAAPTLVGTVLDSTGAPMAGVEVTGGQSWKPATVTSRADGSYGLVLPPYQQQVVAIPPDGDLGRHSLTTESVTIPYSGALEHDLQLDAATVRVRTLLPDGVTPAQHAHVYAPHPTNGWASGTADSAGYVGLALPAGEHTVTARPSDGDSGRALTTQVAVTAPAAELLTVVLPAPNVSGTVSGPGGEPLTVDTAITVTDAVTGSEVGSTFYAKPAADHAFALGLPAGRYELRAHAPRYSANPHRWQGVDVEITVEEGAALPPLDLELQPEGTAPWRAVQVNTDADGGAPDRGATWPSVSRDGTTVAFASWATDLLPGVTGNGNQHLYVRRATSDGLAPTELVTVAHDGGQADRGVYDNEASQVGSLNGDGSLIAFASYATNLTPTPTPTDRTHVYLRDLDTGTTERLSQTADGTEADGGSWAPSLSADGQRVAFLTQSSNLAGPTDSSGVVLLDRTTGTFTLLTGDSSSPPVLSADGTTVAWQERRWDDTVGETLTHVRAHTIGQGTVDVAVPVTRSGDEDHYDRISEDVLDISDDGGTVLFVSTVDAYPLPDTDRFWLYDTASGASTEVSPFGGPVTETNGGVDADLSGDGRSLLFTSEPPRDAVVSNAQVWTKDLATWL